MVFPTQPPWGVESICTGDKREADGGTITERMVQNRQRPASCHNMDHRENNTEEGRRDEWKEGIESDILGEKVKKLHLHWSE